MENPTDSTIIAGLGALDLSIILLYLAATLLVGVLLERRASGSSSDYFLGGRKLPWWALGASGMASNVDIAGTAIAVAFVYVIGISGLFVELRGGVVLTMALLLAFMGKWNRRSGVMTHAEWMKFRFGSGWEGNLARISSSLAEIIFTLWVVAYFSKGLEIFIAPLMPGYDPTLIAIGIILIVLVYTAASGLVGVVWTDVIQGAIIMLGIAYVCWLGFRAAALPETFTVSVPMGDGVFQEHIVSSEAWLSAAPAMRQEIPGQYAMFNAFGLVIVFYVMQQVIRGASGGGGYMMQRYLAARDEREAGLIAALWTVLLAFRWPMVAAFAILGIQYGIDRGAPIENPEQVMGVVLNEFLPPGLKGLLVACFLAAFMSTFSSFINSTSAYVANDLYKPYFVPNASEKSLVTVGRISSLLIVIVGLYVGYRAENINQLWELIQNGLGAALAVPMLIRWYWWRFNGFGFAGGMIFGVSWLYLGPMAAPFIAQLVPDNTSETILLFVSSTLFALIGCIVGTFLGQPTRPEVLDHFYAVTRPFGFWGPVRSKLPQEQIAAIRTESIRDILTAAVAIPWQVCLFLLPMALILKQWSQGLTLLLIVAALSSVLYLVWYRNLAKSES